MDFRAGLLPRPPGAWWADGAWREYYIPGPIPFVEAPGGALGGRTGFYAVTVGRAPGIYFRGVDDPDSRWVPGPPAESVVCGVSGARLRKYRTLLEAMDAMASSVLERRTRPGRPREWRGGPPAEGGELLSEIELVRLGLDEVSKYVVAGVGRLGPLPR
eukprot:tig00021571_g22368.t1